MAMPRRKSDDLARFWSRVNQRGRADCWEWTALRRDSGYGIFKLGDRTYNASRACWILMRGPIAPGLQVCHRCDNPPCVNPDHLFLGTPKENSQDAQRKGRLVGQQLPTGVRATHARITAEECQQMLHRWRAGETWRALGREFGWTRTAIWKAAKWAAAQKGESLRGFPVTKGAKVA